MTRMEELQQELRRLIAEHDGRINRNAAEREYLRVAISQIDRMLRVSAAEHVPAIQDVFMLIDKLPLQIPRILQQFWVAKDSTEFATVTIFREQPKMVDGNWRGVLSGTHSDDIGFLGLDLKPGECRQLLIMDVSGAE